jgi:tRNA(His) 5'-end guanylyltransferase
MPVIIRLDGKAFHTFTKGFEKPFDMVMVRAMQETMKYLCENIQGCVLGYTQSDEITLVLIDYQNLNSDAWFDYEVQKLCSVSASMATFAFNRNFARLAALEPEKKTKQTNAYTEVASKGAFFDARCFNIPKEEVTNCLLWRQQDATRNSIHMTGRAYFSHKQIEGLNSNDIQNLLLQEKGINWNDLPTTLKRGSCCIKKYRQTMNQTFRGYWCIDDEIPIFKDEGRDYIEKLL